MNRLWPILNAIGLRYSAILIQFALVILISRRAAPEVTGGYFIIFGWINSTYFLSGFGLPDGLVREIAHYLGTDQRTKVFSLIRKTALVSGTLTIFTAFIGIFGGLAFHFEKELVILTVIWWLCYATVFSAAQILLALGRSNAGSFFFYPALNVSLLFTLFPFLIATKAPSLDALLCVAITGSVPMALFAVALTLRSLGKFREEAETNQPVPISHIFQLGIRIAVARVAQTTIYWLPTWFAGGASTAAILGLASRLNNAVNAIMAAIRFIIRPQIVRAAARNDWTTICASARRINTLTAGGASIALIIYVFFGQFFLRKIFGQSYASAYWPLAILMLGSLAEATGGIVDEILKMTGNATFVLILLCCTVAFESLLCWRFSQFGPIWLAVSQTTAITILYALQICFVRWRHGVWLLPSMHTKKNHRLLRGQKELSKSNII